MTAEEAAAALHEAVTRYIRRMPASEITGSGTMHVKADLKRVDWPPEGDEFTGALFLSMPFLGADRDWMTKVMAYVRQGCASGHIKVGDGYEVQVDEDERIFAHHDDELGARLFTLPAPVRLHRQAQA
jgi:hypothetical protein